LNLSDLEKYILVAEKDYSSVQSKLNFVNERMYYGREIDKNTGKLIIYPHNRKLEVKEGTYYRKLGTMKTKINQRGHEISKNYLFNLINERDTLLSDRKEMREIMNNAQQLEKMQVVVSAKKEQIDIGRRILSIEELIKTHMEEPDLEDEEQIERQIQLLTTS